MMYLMTPSLLLHVQSRGWSHCRSAPCARHRDVEREREGNKSGEGEGGRSERERVTGVRGRGSRVGRGGAPRCRENWGARA